MKHLCVILISIIIFSLNSFAQEEYTVSGESEFVVNGNTYIKLDLTSKTESKLTPTEICQNSLDGIDFNKDKIFFAANIGAIALAAYEIPRVDNDKTKHFLAGYVVGATATGISQIILPKTMKHRKLVAALIGFGTSVLIGTGKEIYDSKHPLNHTADKNDAFATFAGGAVGSVSFSLTDIKNVFGKRKTKTEISKL